jgi:hypothetical protein
MLEHVLIAQRTIGAPSKSLVLELPCCPMSCTNSSLNIMFYKTPESLITRLLFNIAKRAQIPFRSWALKSSEGSVRESRLIITVGRYLDHNNSFNERA